jgi:hypothetical protein
MTSESPVQQPCDYDDMLRGIKAIAEGLRGIQELGVAQYTPVVDQIIATRSRDARHIRLMLDHLLDFACHPAGLALYKKLSRYYYTLDPAATANYVNYYREMWDTETPEEKEMSPFKKSGGRCAVSAVVSAPSFRLQGRGRSLSEA